MDDAKMFGRRMAYKHKKRCEYCNKPVHHGYIVNDPEFRGFFCSGPHANAAYQNMKKVAEEEGLEIEK